MSKKIIDTHYQHVEANVLFCFIFRRRITFPLVEDDIVWNQSLDSQSTCLFGCVDCVISKGHQPKFGHK